MSVKLAYDKLEPDKLALKKLTPVKSLYEKS